MSEFGLLIVLVIISQISADSPRMFRHRRQSFNFPNLPSLDVDQDKVTTTQTPDQSSNEPGTSVLALNSHQDGELFGDPSGQSFNFGGSSTDWEQGLDVGPPVPGFGNGDLSLPPSGTGGDVGASAAPNTGSSFSFENNNSSGQSSGADSIPNKNFDFHGNFGISGGSEQGSGSQGNTSKPNNEGASSADSVDGGLGVPIPGDIGVPSPLAPENANRESDDSDDGAGGSDAAEDTGGSWGAWGDGNGLGVGSSSGSSNGENKTFDFGSNNGENGDSDWSEGATVPSVGFQGHDLPELDVKVEESTSDTAELDDSVVGQTPRVGQAISAPLRPLDERMCNGQSHFVCKQGYCLDGRDDNNDDTFECICDDGWIGHFCDQPCTLQCQNEGSCRLLDSVSVMIGQPLTEEDMYCNCPHVWTGAHCEDLKPDPEEDAHKLTVILACCIAFVLLLAILLPFLLWRLRVIFIMKFVYLFQNYEDEDGKKYDAYISLSPCPEAESFVYSVLAPRLEDLGFNLYLQARDLPIGAVMSESIIGAIEESRRTIMVVTSDYVEHEWARLEYLFAQRETLKLRQRIIPIIVRDLDQEKVKADKSLKHILSSINCLHLPESLTPSSPNDLSPGSARSPDPLVKTSAILKEKLRHESKEQRFWKRLELTMPKKRKVEEDKRVRKVSKSPDSHDRVNSGRTLQNQFKQTNAKFDISSNFLLISDEKMCHPSESKEKKSRSNLKFAVNMSCAQTNDLNKRKNLKMDPFFSGDTEMEYKEMKHTDTSETST